MSNNADCNFRLEFKPGNRVALTGAIPGGKSDTIEGPFTVDGDRVDVRLPQGMPLQLRFVNGAYETSSLGLPMKFTRQLP